MRDVPKILILALLVYFGQLFGKNEAGGPSSLGSSYVAIYTDIYYEVCCGPTDPELYIATLSNVQVNVTVSTPIWAGGPWTTTVSVVRGTNQMVKVPSSVRGFGASIFDSTVLIEATDAIAVQTINKEGYNLDGWTLYPIDTFGKFYYVTTSDKYSCMQAVAVEPGATTLTISCRETVTWLGTTYYNGDPFTVVLYQYEFWQMCTYSSGPDYTGSTISADKNIGAFSGAYFAGDGTIDHIFNQLVPFETYGQTFGIVGAANRLAGDFFRVIASEDNTIYYLDGSATGTTLTNAGDWDQLSFASNTYHTLWADKAVMVFQIVKSYVSAIESAEGGDPSLAYVPPVEQWANQHLYSTMKGHPSSGDFYHYAVFIIDKNYKDGIIWNDVPVTGLIWNDLPAYNLTSAVQSIPEGVHDFYHVDPTKGFVVMEYGNAPYAAYATTTGSRGAPINTPCNITTTVPDDGVDNDCDGRIDEELLDGIDNDGDGDIDEDLAAVPRVDGGWSNFTDWTLCDCVTLVTIRNRTCDNPEPQGAGIDCTGDDIETLSCNATCEETTMILETTTTTITTTTTPETTTITATTQEQTTSTTTTPEPTTTTATTPEQTTTTSTTPDPTTKATGSEPTTTTTTTPEPTTKTTYESATVTTQTKKKRVYKKRPTTTPVPPTPKPRKRYNKRQHGRPTTTTEEPTTTEEWVEQEEPYNWVPVGVGVGLGLLGIISGIIIAAAIRRRRKKKKVEDESRPNSRTGLTSGRGRQNWASPRGAMAVGHT